MKTITVIPINVQVANERFENIMKGQAKCREHLHKLAGTIHHIKRLTGMMVVLFVLTFSVNAQLTKTNYIGKKQCEVKEAMNSVNFNLFNSVPDNHNGTFMVSYYDQYICTIFYTFDRKNRCISYIIKANGSQKDFILDLIYSEFPQKKNNALTDGTYTANIETKGDITTITVQ